MAMPTTRNGLSATEVISGLQKHVRRGEEELAMQAAGELIYSENKTLIGWCLNRLLVIAHEDVGLANPQAVTFTMLTISYCRELAKDPKKYQTIAMCVGNVILTLCRSEKSRLAGHFTSAAAAGVKLGTEPYVVPDYAKDMHTGAGRRLGRGLDHFREEGAKLDRTSTTLHDPYQERAYANWAKTYRVKNATNSPTLFDDEEGA